MNRSKTAAITTACVSMAVGAAAYMMAGNNTKNKAKKLRKATGRALRQVGEFIDNVSYMMK
ncbi:MAG TPA: hypothetical protein GX499_06910 [Clostridiales bacterium]|nr:hypothetical protein [Clostridiales bacterium]